MKKLIFFAAAAAVCACSQGPKVTITVENPIETPRRSELVEIPLERLAVLTLGEGQTYVVSKDGETVPSQVSHDGLLLFQCGLDGGGKATFKVEAGAFQEFPVRAKGRLAPERYDDFIWENDRVAFRIYGKALEAVDGPSNGIDALYKRSEEMVLDKWYSDYTEKGISYHDDNGTGLDDYKVGRTLGVGAMGPFANFKIFLNSNFTGCEVLDNGPLRTSFRLTYPDLVLTEEYTVTDVRTITLDAGSQLTRVEQEYDFSSPMTVAAGFPLHGDRIDTVKYSSPVPDVLMLEEPATPKASGVYLGLIFPSGMRNVFTDDTSGTPHVLGLGMYRTPKPFVYYTGYAWKDATFGWTPDLFAEYLKYFVARTKTPLVVTIK